MNNFDHCSGEYLNIDGAKIYYEISGAKDKPVLLVLHGGHGNIEDFNSVLPDIEKEYKIIGIDSRGQGKSTIGTEELTYERIQKDIEHVLEHHKIDNLDIIGFSDGGTVAYRLAALTSLKVKKLITIGSKWNIKNTYPLKESFLRITGESWKIKFPKMFDAYQRLSPEPDFDLLTNNLVKLWLDSGLSGYPNEQVKNITCQLLIVRGDDDHLFALKDVAELSGLVKGSKVLNIPYAGHVAFEDQKEIFLISLNEFLKK
ncbi:MAG: alpha/beta hydrolase [Ignavibacteriales bacterium]|nr:alpha/beta hydrolase [Ignavibacteriales bacterium]